MKVYLVWSIDKMSWELVEYLEEIFDTREKAENYIKSLDKSNFEWYNYNIEEREVK